MIVLDLGVFSWVKGFASKIASHNTIKIASDDFRFCPLIIVQILRLNNESDDDWTRSGSIRVG
jgi:hypothetical protein